MTSDDPNNGVIRRRSGKSTGHQVESFTFTTAISNAASISQTGLRRFRLSLVSEMTGLQHHAELKDSQAEPLTDCEYGARERTDLSNSSLQWFFHFATNGFNPHHLLIVIPCAVDGTQKTTLSDRFATEPNNHSTICRNASTRS